MESHSIAVTRAAITQNHSIAHTLPPLADNAVRLKVQSFSITANNITYALIGDAFGYWNFFPVPASDRAETQGIVPQGIVPMWGHAIVLESRHADIQVGERIYGYLPMAEHLDVQPDRISAGGFIDSSAHRQPLSIIYNQYSRISADPEHDAAREDARMLFAPLFKTGFLIDAMFARESWFGADQMILTSASSKTALALAHCVREGSAHIRRIGLTSSGNISFVKSTSLYDEVLSYDAISHIPQGAAVLVDFAGNSGLLRDVHSHLGAHLAYSCLVGATHTDARGLGGSKDPLPGVKPILFFAPDHATALLKDIGPKAFGAAVAARWHSFIALTDDMVTIEQQQGLDAAGRIFAHMAAGNIDPAVGTVIYL
jgi:Protein of unknown function (DUF2855)